MTDQKKVTPRKGLLVPLADGNGNLPPEGKVVGMTSYWWQRKFDGDVTVEDVPQETPAAGPGLPAEGSTPTKPHKK